MSFPEYHGPIEYFLASDPSAVIEHTNRVLFLEDGDVAAIQVGHCALTYSTDLNAAQEGSLKIHRFNKDRKEDSREIQVRRRLCMSAVFTPYRRWKWS